MRAIANGQKIETKGKPMVNARYKRLIALFCACGALSFMADLRAAEPKGSLVYPAEGNINLKQGSLQIWTKTAFDPQAATDDSAEVQSGHQELFFLFLSDEKNQFYVYWNALSRSLVAALQRRDEEASVLISTDPNQGALTKGEEQVITVSWDEEQVVIYLGTNFIGTSTRSLGIEEGELQSAKLCFTGGFAIDAIRILDVPFDPEKPDAFQPTLTPNTLMLDTFSKVDPDGSETHPEKIAAGGEGGKIINSTISQGRFGKRLQFIAP